MFVKSNRSEFVRFEVFTAVTMKNAVFWDMAPCRSCVRRSFGGTYRLHLQSRKIRQRETSVSSWLQTSWKKRRKSRSAKPVLLPASCWSLAWFILGPWRWWRYVSPKCLLMFTRVHGLLSQKAKLFEEGVVTPQLCEGWYRIGGVIQLIK
jgi:hypothetical protein